jgi:hypothetical protein
MKVPKCANGLCPVLKNILFFKAYCFLMKRASALMGKLTNRIFTASVKENSQWYSPNKEQGAKQLMVWCGVWHSYAIGLFYSNGTVMAGNYSDMLGDCLMAACDELRGHPKWFMQDSAPLPYALFCPLLAG